MLLGIRLNGTGSCMHTQTQLSRCACMTMIVKVESDSKHMQLLQHCMFTLPSHRPNAICVFDHDFGA